jgi:hypothetical protein
MDSGFCDQKLMKIIKVLGTDYVFGGRFLPEIKTLLGAVPTEDFQRHFCDYLEFDHQC